MRYAVQQGLTENNPALHLEGVTAPPVKNHYPALPLERLPELFERIGDYQQGRQLTRLAVVLTLHLFIRSCELRFARWSEIDFRHKTWTIPPHGKRLRKFVSLAEAHKCVLRTLCRFPDRQLLF